MSEVLFLFLLELNAWMIGTHLLLTCFKEYDGRLADTSILKGSDRGSRLTGLGN